MSSNKQYPNIIICGTPGISLCIHHLFFIFEFSLSGVGKSRFCQELCTLNKSLKSININDLAKQHRFLLEYDEENQCEILDDDTINDYLDDQYFQRSFPSGLIIDYHSAGIIPDNNHIHGIVVLRCNNDKLYDRLKNRNYSEKKIEQHIQSEVFQVCLNEAREAFDETIVHELINETDDDLKKNIEYLLKWIDRWPFNDTME
jgi:adenylate kinase